VNIAILGLIKLVMVFARAIKKAYLTVRFSLKIAGFSDRIYSYIKNIKQNKSFKLGQLFNIINIFLNLFGFCFYNKGAVKGFLIRFLRKIVYYYFNGWRNWF